MTMLFISPFPVISSIVVQKFRSTRNTPLENLHVPNTHKLSAKKKDPLQGGPKNSQTQPKRSQQ